MSTRDATASHETVITTPRVFNARQWVVIAIGWMLYSLVRALLTQITPGERMPWLPSTVALVAIGCFWTLVTPVVFSLAVRLRTDQVGLPRAITVHSLMAVLAAFSVAALRHSVFQLMMPDMKPTFSYGFVAMFDYNVITYAMLAVFGSALDRRRA